MASGGGQGRWTCSRISKTDDRPDGACALAADPSSQPGSRSDGRRATRRRGTAMMRSIPAACAGASTRLSWPEPPSSSPSRSIRPHLQGRGRREPGARGRASRRRRPPRRRLPQRRLSSPARPRFPRRVLRRRRRRYGRSLAGASRPARRRRRKVPGRARPARRSGGVTRRVPCRRPFPLAEPSGASRSARSGTWPPPGRRSPGARQRPPPAHAPRVRSLWLRHPRRRYRARRRPRPFRARLVTTIRATLACRNG